MDKGWIKLYRQISENHFLMQDNNAFMVFTKLLMKVGKNKGEWSGGRTQLGEYMNMNPRTLYDVLIRLENNGLINISANSKYSVISICKWHYYQGDAQQVAQPQPNHSPTAAQHSNKKKKENSSKGLDFSEYQELEPELKAFVEMRKVLKKPLTASAINLVVAKIRKYYPDDVASQKACLNQSVENSWQGVFELKTPVAPKRAARQYDGYF